jgi:predicted transcriptional regulator of viral defense system
MRVKRAGPRAPQWDRLYETAAPQAGYLTLAQARSAGYSSPLVEYHVRVGRLERVGRGVFRLVHFPPTGDEDLVRLWLWSARKGVFSHETALMLHQLSDALPAKTHMTLPGSWQRRRLRVPRGLVLRYHDVPARDAVWFGPVPLTSPLRTVVDVTLEGDPAVAEQAARQAVRRRIFLRADLRRALADRTRSEATAQ